MKDYIDTLLQSCFGNKTLVDNWWNSENYVFNFKTPLDAWYENEDVVIDYVMGMLCGHYGNGE